MANTVKLLDENSLLAIKAYVDTYGGKVDDVKINNTSILASKIANISVDGTYNSSSNKIASVSTVTNAIGDLDVPASGTGAITGFGAGKTLASLTETDGKIAATFQNISITSSQISDKTNSYSATGTVAVTGTAIKNALDTLTDTLTGSPAASKTITAFDEVGGKVTATFSDIAIAESQVTNLTSDLASKVPTSRTIAGLALSSNISSSDLRNALDLTTALVYIGQATTTQPSAGHYVKTVIGGTTYYVSMDSEGSAQQVNAEKGQILTIGTKEYICTTGGASGTNVFSEMGDEGSYALKTITITGTGALGGGGTLEANRTITHNAGNAASKTSGFYKFSTDAYSHVNSVTAVALSDLTGLGAADNSKVVHLGTYSSPSNETIYGTKEFTNRSSETTSINGGYVTLTTPDVETESSFGLFVDSMYQEGDGPLYPSDPEQSPTYNDAGGQILIGIYDSENVTDIGTYPAAIGFGTKYDTSKKYGIVVTDFSRPIGNQGGDTTYDYYRNFFEFPKASGTIALTSDLSGYLPLTAGSSKPLTGDLYLGNGTGGGALYLYNSSAGSEATHKYEEIYGGGDTAVTIQFYNDIGDDGGQLWFVPDGFVRYLTPGTTSYTYTLPNATGTLALTSDITITGVTDGLFDLSVSSKNLSVSAYSSKGAGHFYTGTTAPSNNNRLNYDGYFYATKLYSGGSEVLTSHQSIKTLNTTATTAQSTSASEAINGSGTITLHKIAKTGTYSDLIGTPDLSGYVSGPSSATDNAIALFDGTTGKTIKNSSVTITTSNSVNTLNLGASGILSDGTNSKSVADIKSHLDNTTIHVTSANKTTWNAKVSSIRVLAVDGATDDDDYQKLQYTSDGSTYTDVVSCMSYNEAWAVLTASN